MEEMKQVKGEVNKNQMLHMEGSLKKVGIKYVHTCPKFRSSSTWDVSYDDDDDRCNVCVCVC